MGEWKWAFPRLAALYCASDKSEKNYFEHPNVVSALVARDPYFVGLEEALAKLNDSAWADFVGTAAHYVDQQDRWGYSSQLFECFNEARAFAYLRSEGYQGVSFVPRS